MPAPAQHTYRFRVEVDGQPLRDEIDADLVRVLVDTSLNLPDHLVLCFRDETRDAITRSGVQVGSGIVVKVHSEEHPGGEKVFDGEVTTLEAELDTLGILTIVRGYDRSHRLFHGRVTKSYVDMAYSDIAREVAQRVGLELGTIDATRPRHAHVAQTNSSNWNFVKHLAAEVGFESAVVEGKFHFRRPTHSSSGPTAGTLSSAGPLELAMGSNLLRFRSTVSSVEQVGAVEVRGWDMLTKKEVKAREDTATDATRIGTSPSDLAAKFDSPTHVAVDVPYSTQEEVEVAAKALSDQLGSAFAELEGVARGEPRLRAGTVASLGLVEAPFDGQYLVTSARHIWEPDDGYTVAFTMSGSRDRSVLGLLLGAVGMASGEDPAARIDGVVTGIVTDLRDPDRLNRVKLTFPWLADDYESGWARVAHMGAGDARGWLALPEVNDEVLVAFDHGDVRKPFVLGGLYNGVDKPGSAATDSLLDGSSGAVNRRAFVSRTGHHLLFVDESGKEQISLATGDDGYQLTLDQSGTKLTITSQGEVRIEGQRDVKISSTGGNVEISGTQVKVSATSGLTLDGGPTATLRGGTVNIN